MAIEHARLCGRCDKECPSWADRCPSCGGMSFSHRIVIIPPEPLAGIACQDRSAEALQDRAAQATVAPMLRPVTKRMKTPKTTAPGAAEGRAR